MNYIKPNNPEKYYKGQFFSDKSSKSKYYFKGKFFSSRYGNLMHDDMPHQYRNRPKTAYLLDALGRQMDEVRQFLFDVMIHRSIDTAVGIQLDHIGSIVCLTRDEARELFDIKTSVVSDDRYRDAIKYKIHLNYSTSTYDDIFKYLRLYFNSDFSNVNGTPYVEKDILGFKFTEEQNTPAAIIVESGDGIKSDLPTIDEINAMVDAKVPRGAGIGLKYRIHQPIESNFYVKFGEPRNIIDIESSVEPLGYENKFGIRGDKNTNGDYFEFLTDENGNILADEDGDLIAFDHRGPAVDFYATENLDVVTNGNGNIFISEVKQVEI